MDRASPSLAIGVITFLIPLCFLFSPLGHTEDYIRKDTEQPAVELQDVG